MRFKIDENLPGEIALDLLALGHDAQTAWEEGLQGAPDPALLERVRREGRVLLTLDKGIADVRRYPPVQYLELAGRLVVVTDQGIRRR
jgi:predicted nuclease of predicted toxin-antitoxin system